MKRIIGSLVLVLAVGCASSQGGDHYASRSGPGLRGEGRGTEAGYFPLPGPLHRDPKSIKHEALDLKVIKPERITWDNGLTIYLMPDPAVPLIDISALVGAGNFDDAQGKIGTAAMTFDLMASAGAGNLGADALDELLEFHAADANGGAGDESAMLSLNVQAKDFDQLLPVFADMLLRPRFEQGRVDVSVAALLEAIRRRPDSPDGLAARALRKAIFGPDSIYGRESSEKTIKAIRREDLQAFHKRAVVPKATRLLVTGNYDREKMLAALKAQFGNWKGGEPMARTYPTPATPTRRVIFIPKDTPQAKIRVGGFGYPRRSPEEYPMRVVSSALGSFGIGRLYKEIRDERGLAYSATSHVFPGPTTGQFVASTDTQPQTAVEALAAVLEILEKTAGQQPLTKPEISSATDMFLNSFAFKFDSSEKIVREKATFDLFGYPDDYLDKFRDNISKVDPEAARAAAQKLYDPKAVQLVVVGPKSLQAGLDKFGPVQVINNVDTFQ